MHISWAHSHKDEGQLSLSIDAKMRTLLDCEATLLLGKPLQISQLFCPQTDHSWCDLACERMIREKYMARIHRHGIYF